MPVPGYVGISMNVAVKEMESPAVGLSGVEPQSLACMVGKPTRLVTIARQSSSLCLQTCPVKWR